MPFHLRCGLMVVSIVNDCLLLLQVKRQPLVYDPFKPFSKQKCPKMAV